MTDSSNANTATTPTASETKAAAASKPKPPAAKKAKEPKAPEVKLPKFSAGKVEKNVPLANIVADHEETQAREKMNNATVKAYRELMEDGTKFPPLDVFKDGGSYILADGFHRLQAMLDAGIGKCDVRVREGGKREAILFSLSANSSHGLQRTTKDKQRAVHALLTDEEWKKCSDREIAKHAGVSNVMVSKYRNKLKKAAGEEIEETGKGSKGGRIRQELSEPEQTSLDDLLAELRGTLTQFAKKLENQDPEFIKRLINAEIKTLVADLTVGEDGKRKVHPNRAAGQKVG